MAHRLFMIMYHFRVQYTRYTRYTSLRTYASQNGVRAFPIPLFREGGLYLHLCPIEGVSQRSSDVPRK